MSSRARWAESRLRYTFKDPGLLEQALTHRSASRNNNERLEYLGDSFLSFAIARRLYAARPEDTEGDLSRARAALVREATLAAIGQQLRLDATRSTVVHLSTGEPDSFIAPPRIHFARSVG